jgi:hypothetical protein
LIQHILPATAGAMILLSGCVGVSYTHSDAGGGQVASSCVTIKINDNSGQSAIANSCGTDVNLLDLNNDSRGLIVVRAGSTVQRQETIGAWGACIAPSVPRRTGNFEYYCD